MKLSKLTKILLPLIVAALNIMIIIFPRESLAAARDGLLLWAQNVLPGILPFVIGANILMALGAANFLGELLAPIMRRVFRVPGIGGFALAIGLMSGYPIGTKVVCEMRLDGQLSRAEAQRLVAFTSNAGPLFILGAVAAGMFASRPLGYFMLAAHYLGALTVGLLMRFYGGRSERGKKSVDDGSFPLHIRAFRAMDATRRKDGQSFGAIFGQSVKNAVETMLIIGGFIVLFAVISTILELSGVFYALSTIFAPILGLLGISQAYHAEIFAGLIEMTNGVSMLSQHGISPQAVALVTAIISFGGLSILFQSINFISKTDISVPIFALCKLAHGLFAAIYTAILYPFFAAAIESEHAVTVYNHGMVSRFVQSSTYFAMAMIVVLVIGICAIIVRAARRGS